MPTLPEEIYDRAIRDSVRLERTKEGMSRNVLAILRRLENRIVARVQRLSSLPQNASNDRRIRRLRALREDVTQLSRTAFLEMRRQSANDLVDLGETIAEGETNNLAILLGAALITNNVTRTSLRTVLSEEIVEGDFFTRWWSRQPTSFINSVFGQLSMGVLAGESVSQITQRLVGSAALPIDGVFNPGIYQTARRNATALVRTFSQYVAQRARFSLYEQNRDIFRAVRAVVVLDTRTSAICQARSGLEWEFDDPEFPGHPPWHWNCRTILVPVTFGYRQILGNVNDPEARRGLREANRENPFRGPSQDYPYEEWLRRQTPSVQREALGSPYKLRQWREGNLSLRQLIDQSGNPLSIAQLREMIE